MKKYYLFVSDYFLLDGMKMRDFILVDCSFGFAYLIFNGPRSCRVYEFLCNYNIKRNDVEVVFSYEK